MDIHIQERAQCLPSSKCSINYTVIAIISLWLLIHDDQDLTNRPSSRVLPQGCTGSQGCVYSRARCLQINIYNRNFPLQRLPRPQLITNVKELLDWNSYSTNKALDSIYTLKGLLPAAEGALSDLLPTKRVRLGLGNLRDMETRLYTNGAWARKLPAGAQLLCCLGRCDWDSEMGSRM